MNRIAIATVLSAAALGAQAETFQDNARVRSVEPQYEQVSIPREQCSQQWINESRPVGGGSDNPSYGGMAIGGVAGGVIGHQIGKGSGRDVATAVGAVVGALAGDRVGRNTNQPQQYETVPRQVTQCQTVNEVQNRLTGYRVTYDYRGQLFTSFMRDQPGANIPVRVSIDPVVR